MVEIDAIHSFGTVWVGTLIPILAYHGVEQTQPEIEDLCFAGRTYKLNSLRVKVDSFRKQMRYLSRKGYHTVRLDDVFRARQLGGSLSEKSVALTFDDGFNDLHLPAGAILKEYGFTATIFLVVERISEKGGNGFLTWQQVRDMQQAGFTFGAHTLTHPFLTSLSEEEAFNEIFESKRIIEERTQKSVNFFCYPFGDFNSQVVEFTKKCGFKGAVVTPTNPYVKESAFTMKRVGINRGNSMTTFMLKLNGIYDAFRDNPFLFRLGDVRKRVLLSLAKEVS